MQIKEKKTWLLVGLGNIGRAYARTWHNLGFLALEKLAQKHHIDCQQKKFKGIYGKGEIAGQEVYLLYPQTMMNLSGEAVQALAAYFKIPPSQIIVFYDDLDLPCGKIRFREKGSAGTHNGMRSVLKHLGTEHFPRIRLGMGKKPEEIALVDFVLMKIPSSKESEVEKMLDQACEAVEIYLRSDLDKVHKFLNEEKQEKGA